MAAMSGEWLRRKASHPWEGGQDRLTMYFATLDSATSKPSFMDTRGAPQWIVNAHPPDQRAQVRVDLRSASKGARFPPPISPEAGPVPAHQGLRPDDRDGLEDRWKPSIQHDQEQAIPIRELDAAAHPPLQHNQLMSECRVLCRKSVL